MHNSCPSGFNSRSTTVEVGRSSCGCNTRQGAASISTPRSVLYRVRSSGPDFRSCRKSGPSVRSGPDFRDNHSLYIHFRMYSAIQKIRVPLWAEIQQGSKVISILNPLRASTRYCLVWVLYWHCKWALSVLIHRY